MNLRLLLPLTVAAGLTTACAADRASDDRAESSSSSVREERDEEVANIDPEYPILEGGGEVKQVTLTTEESNVITLDYRVAIDGMWMAEGDVVVSVGEGMETRAATTIGRRWNRAVVPYVIDPNFPDPSRATLAIQHWREKTNVRFVERTNESDYVTFRTGSGCSSMIGRQGGNQAITLSMGEGPSSIAAVGIDRGANSVYYFYKRGFATAGTTARADAKRTHFKYTLPAGKTTSNLIDVGFNAQGHVVAWYNDGTFSEGSITNFAQYAAPASYALASGKTAADVLGFAIDGSNAAYAFYKDGTYSKGTASNLASAISSNAFAAHATESIANIAHVDVGANGSFQAFYADGKTSTGTVSNLGSQSPATLSRVAFPGHCAVGQAIHEIGHAVGYFHEQTRQDRDNYVTINTANISSGHGHNFQKYSGGNDVGPYDYGSIMHYGSYAFSSNGQPTIVRKDGSTIDGQRLSLSTGDVAAANAMYPGPPAF